MLFNELWEKEFMKEYKEMTLQELKDEVTKLLITDHDATEDDAEELVTNSMHSHPEFWHDKAEAKDLANFLASDENDD